MKRKTAEEPENVRKIEELRKDSINKIIFLGLMKKFSPNNKNFVDINNILSNEKFYDPNDYKSIFSEENYIDYKYLQILTDPNIKEFELNLNESIVNFEKKQKFEESTIIQFIFDINTIKKMIFNNFGNINDIYTNSLLENRKIILKKSSFNKPTIKEVQEKERSIKKITTRIENRRMDIMIGYYLNRLRVQPKQNGYIPQTLSFSLLIDWAKTRYKRTENDLFGQSNTKENDIDLLMMEGGDVIEFDKIDYRSPFFKNYLIRILHTLHIGQLQYGFIHGDLHTDNIMTTKLSNKIGEKYKYFSYDIEYMENEKKVIKKIVIPCNEEYEINEDGNLSNIQSVINKKKNMSNTTIPLIIDFDRSRIQVPYRNAHLKKDLFKFLSPNSFVVSGDKTSSFKYTRILRYTKNDPNMNLQSYSEINDDIKDLKSFKSLVNYFKNEKLTNFLLENAIVKFYDKKETEIGAEAIVGDGDFSLDMRRYSVSFIESYLTFRNCKKSSSSMIINELFKKIKEEKKFSNKLNFYRCILGNSKFFEIDNNKNLSEDKKGIFLEFENSSRKLVRETFQKNIETIDELKTRMKNIFGGKSLEEKGSIFFKNIKKNIHDMLKQFCGGIYWVIQDINNITVTSFIDELSKFIIKFSSEINNSWGISAIFYSIIEASIFYNKSDISLKKNFGHSLHILFSMTCIDEVIFDINFSKFRIESMIKIAFNDLNKYNKLNYLKKNFGLDQYFFLNIVSNAIKFDREKPLSNNDYSSSLIAYYIYYFLNYWDKKIEKYFEMDVIISYRYTNCRPLIFSFINPFKNIIDICMTTIPDEHKRIDLIEDYYKNNNIIEDNTLSIIPSLFMKRPIDILRYLSKDISDKSTDEYLSMGTISKFSDLDSKNNEEYYQISKCANCQTNYKKLYYDNSIKKIFCGEKCQLKYYIKKPCFNLDNKF